MLIPDGLASELAALHPDQRLAATQQGNLVVRAGPGSGKTRTLVARTGHSLSTSVSPFRGVACITYTRSGAAEIRSRLHRLGLRPGHRLVCGTLHSFCLNQVLIPIGHLGNFATFRNGAVVSDSEAEALLQSCLDDLTIADKAQWVNPQVTRIRRSIALDESLDEFDDRLVAASRQYEASLQALGRVDFEAMVFRARDLVRDSEAARDLLRARFPQLLVDEYQDLGGVLHNIVLLLAKAGVEVCAFGDADQTVFGFTGADPRYLESLATQHRFDAIELTVNYRSGSDIIAASEAVFGNPRGRVASEGRPPGEVNAEVVSGGLVENARAAVRIVEQTLAAGIPAERVAVLYPRRGPLLQGLLTELQRVDIPFLHERDDLLPGDPLSLFVQRCASRAIASSHLRTVDVGGDEAVGSRRSDVPTLYELEAELHSLRLEAGLQPPASSIALLRGLQRALDPPHPHTAESSASSFVAELTAELQLDCIVASAPSAEWRLSLQSLLDGFRPDLKLEDLAAAVRVVGKVVVTTYHSAKGREFDTVILPGLVAGVVPPDVHEHGVWRAPTGKALEEQRRAFYVAVTRAERALYLLGGNGIHTPYGRWIQKGVSPFLADMARRLQ